MKKEFKQMWVCSECGSIHVQQKVWANLNESSIDWDSSSDLDEYWCKDCEGKSVELRTIKTVNGAVRVQGYQVEDDKAEMHPDMDASFCLYSLEQANAMLNKQGYDPNHYWQLKAYYKGVVEEPTLMFEGKDPRKTS